MSETTADQDRLARNAGPKTLSVWRDGTFVIHGLRDAEYAKLSEPDEVVLTLDLTTHEPVTFITAAERLRLAVKLFGSASKGFKNG